MRSFCGCIFLGAALIIAVNAQGGGGGIYQSLKVAVLSGYDAGARPGTPDAPVLVEVGIAPNTMRIEEWNSALHTDAFLLLSWQDERLAWNPADYSDVKTLRLSPTSVWLPDIALQNEIPSFASALQAIEKLVLVYSNGTVLWVPSVTLKAPCALDLRKFPRDRHRCQLLLGSWTYDKKEIDIALPAKAIRTDFFSGVLSSWYLSASYAEKDDKTYPDIEGVYPVAEFTFYLRRHLTPYCITVYTPILACVMAGIAALLLCQRRTSGSAMVITTLVNTGVLLSTVMYHGITLRIAGCTVPCIFKFVGGFIMLEAILLPLKAIHANYLSTAEAMNGKGPKALPRFAAVLVNFSFLRRGKKDRDDDAFLLASEVDQKNNEDWLKLGFIMWLMMAVVFFVGLGLLTWYFMIAV